METIQFIVSIFGMMLWLFVLAVAVAIPFIFAASVFRYVHARSQNKKVPGTYSDLEMKKRKLFLVVSSVVFGALAAVFVGLVLIYIGAVAYM